MTVRLRTTLDNLESSISNEEDIKTVQRFFHFMKKIGTSERYQNNNLKAIINYSKFLGPSITLNQVKSKADCRDSIPEGITNNCVKEPKSKPR